MYLVDKSGVSFWSEVPCEAKICMSFGAGVHDASWLYVCATETLIVRVFDVQERHYKVMESFQLARPNGNALCALAARKPWAAGLFRSCTYTNDNLALYRHGEVAPLWVVSRWQLDCPRFTRNGLHVAILERKAHKGVLEIFRLHDGKSEGLIFAEMIWPSCPLQLQDDSWLTVRERDGDLIYDNHAVWKVDPSDEVIWNLVLVPSRGVMVTSRRKVILLTTPDQANMDAMSDDRVAWMTAVRRSPGKCRARDARTILVLHHS